MKKSPPKTETHSRNRRSTSRRRTSRKTSGRRSRPRRASRPRVLRGSNAKVAHALALMRRGGISLARAAKESGVHRNTIVRLVGASLRKLPNGRFAARTSDRLVRVVRMPTVDGVRDVSLRNSKDATLVGEYWNAVHAYLAKGDTVGLERFVGLHVTTPEGERIVLLTDHASLDRLGSAGVLSFESMYAKVL